MNEYSAGPEAGLAMIPLLVMLGAYLYVGFTYFKMAQKCGHSDSAWWSFIPILNLFLMIKLANKPGWWFLLCLIPGVNVIIFAILGIETAKALGQDAPHG